MVRNPIRPNENAKHMKFDKCDAAAGGVSSTAAVLAPAKKSKNEIRDARCGNFLNAFSIDIYCPRL